LKFEVEIPDDSAWTIYLSQALEWLKKNGISVKRIG